MFKNFGTSKFVMPLRHMTLLCQQYQNCFYILNSMSDKWHQIFFFKSYWIVIEQDVKCRRPYLSGDRHTSYLEAHTKWYVEHHMIDMVVVKHQSIWITSSIRSFLSSEKCLFKMDFDRLTVRVTAEYYNWLECEDGLIYRLATLPWPMHYLLQDISVSAKILSPW